MTSRYWAHLFSALLASQPGLAAAQDQVHEFARPCMGTVFSIKIAHTSPEKAEEAQKAFFALMGDLEQKFSDYRPDSELNLLCKNAGKPQSVSDPLFRILARSREFSHWSGGLFDVTIAPCSQLWRESVKTRRLPDGARLQAAKLLVGYESVKLDEDAKSVLLEKVGMQLDLGGIAKGFALDEACRLLQNKFGLDSFLINAGGQLAAMGKPEGKAGWILGIEAAEGETPAEHLSLADLHLATSGVAAQRVEIGGERYAHIINPKTGLGIQYFVQASVIAKEGTTADAAATVLCLLPPEEGLALLAKLRGAPEARIVWEAKDGSRETFTSKGWSRFRADGKKR